MRRCFLVHQFTASAEIVLGFLALYVSELISVKLLLKVDSTLLSFLAIMSSISSRQPANNMLEMSDIMVEKPDRNVSKFKIRFDKIKFSITWRQRFCHNFIT